MIIYVNSQEQADFRIPCGVFKMGPVLASWNEKILVIGKSTISELRDRFGFSYQQLQIENK